MIEPTDEQWRAIQALIDDDCPMSIVAQVGQNEISWEEACDRISAYAQAAFTVASKMHDDEGQDDEGQDDDLHEFFGGACQRCNGEGLIVICPDDLCRADDWCMHGDGMATCPDCGGEG